MRRTYFGWILTFALAATLGCRAPSPNWNGTWKLNPIESSYQGQVLTISISANDDYHFNEKSSQTLHCDGKDRPIGDNRTLLCVKGGITALDIVLKENGIKTKTTHDQLSTDGNVFTTTVTEFRPNGPVITSQIIFSRLSGVNGFGGRWRDTSYLQQHADITLRLDDQALHIGYPSADEQIDAPLDGAEAPVDGPHVLEGTSFAVRPVGIHEFFIITKRHRKVFAQGSLKLSADGKTIIESWWNPNQPTDKGTLVYDRK